MKRLALLTALSFSLFGAAPVRAETDAALTVASIQPSEVTALAPADRYFGRLRMSVLGMRNAIKDISLRIDATDVTNIDELKNQFHKLVFVEDALNDLKNKFPRDTWLPRLGVALAQDFAKLTIEDAAVRANDALDWVLAEYPTSDAALGAKDMRAASLATGATIDVPIEPTLAIEPAP
jgi:hypothetical protein